MARKSGLLWGGRGRSYHTAVSFYPTEAQACIPPSARDQGGRLVRDQHALPSTAVCGGKKQTVHET